MFEQSDFYVAYGSNLSVEQMRYRCPGAKVFGKGVLKGWKLEFRTHANIVPAPGCEVPVVVWKITRQDRASLDRYEGYPRYYVRKIVEVKMEDDSTEFAMVYVMTDKKKRLPPACSYLSTILEGYARFGFSPAPVAQALDELEQSLYDAEKALFLLIAN